MALPVDRPVDRPGEQAVQRRAHEGGPGWGSPMFGPQIPHGFYPVVEIDNASPLRWELRNCSRFNPPVA
ncbi:MAG: hypothetical protein ACJ736_08115 [Streptomyces sp.]